MKIYVAVRNHGREGFSKPLAAFATKEMADVYLAGAEACGGIVEIVEMELKGAPKPAVPVFRPAEITPRDDFNKLIARY